MSPGQTRLGRYELLARLATGGMGEIFLARLEGAAGFEKLYVVKRILPHLADDARFRQMLIAEARIAAKMAHANICHVYELGETDGQLYIVMEYLEGVSVLPMLRRSSKANRSLELGLIAGVIQQTCDGLHYAHELRDRDGSYLGIVHRDVTPSNIFLTESGIAKLLDFGIAKAKGASTQTQEGTVKGKYAYMAPEQLRGASIDRRVDIFALGVVLYEMLALRRLFQRNTDYLTFRAVLEQPIPDIRRYRPDLPEPLVAVLMHALERDPSTRFETARQLGTALLDALSPARPWSQGEISDFVRREFADDLGKRSQQVAKVVAHTGVGRPTVPVLAQQDEEIHDDEGDDDDFPPVETQVDSSPKFVPQPLPPKAGMAADFAVGGTPPPFGGETDPSQRSLVPLDPVPPGIPSATHQVVVVKRGMLWPLLAVAFLAVAGGALFLVWQQMQKQQPAVVNITSTPDTSARVVTPPAPADAAVAAAPVDAADVLKPPPVRPQHKRAASYDAAIAEKKPELATCINEHKDTLPTGTFKAVIKVGASGRAKSVGFEPESVSATPLGTCIRNVLSGADYPASAAEVEFKVPLHVGGA
ncbi:MAG TPA: serine/threonine-protein kinase [Kofleriaceae bacterium]|nr:serine/threonine-protein kinase [Kofleriaceae bacterium]